MDKERSRKKAEARLARLRPTTGHARNLRRKLGLGEFGAPAPVVEAQATVVEAQAPPKKKKKADKKK